MAEESLLSVEKLSKYFPIGGGMFAKPKAWVKAVEGVSFNVRKQENFGVVGESGCGKTTMGRMILNLIEPTTGRIVFDGTDITPLSRSRMKPFRRHIQTIFQDPYSSLDPRMKVASIVAEPLRGLGGYDRLQRRRIVAELIAKVGLGRADLDKFPHEFSGGQRQRIGIARALCVRPKLIVADEPVSALDVSIQAQVLNLLDDLKAEFNLSYLFISHDIGVVEHMCDRVAVMYLGRIVEIAGIEAFRRNPLHPYTEALRNAVPAPDPRHRIKPYAMKGDVPDPISPPPGCAFHPRCDYAFEKCSVERPRLKSVESGHDVACWYNDGRGLVMD